jgi:hypothetical protein
MFIYPTYAVVRSFLLELGQLLAVRSLPILCLMINELGVAVFSRLKQIIRDTERRIRDRLDSCLSVRYL